MSSHTVKEISAGDDATAPPPESARSERALIAAAKVDPAAFAQLYDTHIDRVYAFVRRRTAEDALAEDITAITFEKALRALPNYEQRGAGFCAWLLRIARNELVSYQRKQRWFTWLQPGHASSFNLDWLVERNEDVAEIHQALGKLSAGDQELLALRFFEELSNPEIAEVLACSVDNVYLRLHRALKRLTKAYDTLHSAASEERIHVLE